MWYLLHTMEKETHPWHPLYPNEINFTLPENICLGAYWFIVIYIFDNWL